MPVLRGVLRSGGKMRFTPLPVGSANASERCQMAESLMTVVFPFVLILHTLSFKYSSME